MDLPRRHKDRKKHKAKIAGSRLPQRHKASKKHKAKIIVSRFAIANGRYRFPLPITSPNTLPIDPFGI